jgi:hypothetical protein
LTGIESGNNQLVFLCGYVSGVIFNFLLTFHLEIDT